LPILVGTVTPGAGRRRGDAPKAARCEVAVRVCGADEGHTGIDRRVRHRRGLVDVTPIAAGLPGTQADHQHAAGDIIARTPQSALFTWTQVRTARKSVSC